MTLGTKGGILLSCAALALPTTVGFAWGSASELLKNKKGP